VSEHFNLRALGPDDWEVFREMRLCALQHHQGVFGDNYDESRQRPDEYWHETLNGQGKGVFGLFDGQKIIGITAIFTDREDPSGQTAVLAMSYILPEYRGHKLSRLLYTARIDWAKDQPQLTRIVVSHRESNEASRRANQAFGFKYIGSKEKVWPDGITENQCLYEMRIRP
jgi:RimJ/RimL family protein N-acetyltransferase